MCNDLSFNAFEFGQVKQFKCAITWVVSLNYVFSIFGGACEFGLASTICETFLFFSIITCMAYFTNNNNNNNKKLWTLDFTCGFLVLWYVLYTVASLIIY